MPNPPEVLSTVEVHAKTDILGGRIIVRNKDDRARPTETICLLLPSRQARQRLDTARAAVSPISVSDSRPRSPLQTPPQHHLSRTATAMGDRSMISSSRTSSPNFRPSAPVAATADVMASLSLGEDGVSVYLDDEIIARVAFARVCGTDALEAVADEGDAEGALRAAFKQIKPPNDETAN
jgi:hypothetical protein